METRTSAGSTHRTRLFLRPFRLYSIFSSTIYRFIDRRGRIDPILSSSVWKKDEKHKFLNWNPSEKSVPSSSQVSASRFTVFSSVFDFCFRFCFVCTECFFRSDSHVVRINRVCVEKEPTMDFRWIKVHRNGERFDLRSIFIMCYWKWWFFWVNHHYIIDSFNNI